MSSPVVIHLIESITRGGAMRAAMAVAKYIPRSFPSQHFIAPINPAIVESEAVVLSQQSGLQVLRPQGRDQLLKLIEGADLVHLHWWNNPFVDEFLRSELPPHRLVVWCHVGGHAPPQVISPELLSFADFVVACSPYTYESPAIQNLAPEVRISRTAMAYGPADFERLGSIAPKPHQGFRVGYIGTIEFTKMHPQFAFMSARAEIPGVQFVIAGGGGAERVLREQLETLHITSKFEFRGYVEDLKPLLEELDVFGYPLCEDNYSGSEVVLQEVMYAGIPVVVFPYGGVSRLVIDGFTGLVVRSELEYGKALEYLYQHPEERKRLGSNARTYAQQIFGTEPAAHVFRDLYQRVLTLEKRTRSWMAASAPLFRGLVNDPADRFIASLGKFGRPYFQSRYGKDLAETLAADEEIGSASELMRLGGIGLWRRAYPQDPFLSLWNGLVELHAKHYAEAVMHFAEAANHGFNHWRIGWYLAQAARGMGNFAQAKQALQFVLQMDPQFTPAIEMMKTL